MKRVDLQPFMRRCTRLKGFAGSDARVAKMSLPFDVIMKVLEKVALMRTGARERYARIRRYDAAGVPRKMMCQSDHRIREYLRERQLLPEGHKGLIRDSGLEEFYFKSRRLAHMEPGTRRVARLKAEIATAKDLLDRIPPRFMESGCILNGKRAWDEHEVNRVSAEFGIITLAYDGVFHSWFDDLHAKRTKYHRSVAFDIDRGVCVGAVRNTALGVHRNLCDDPATVEKVLTCMERVSEANAALKDVRDSVLFASKFKYTDGKFQFFLRSMDAFVPAALRLQRLVDAVEEVIPGLCTSGPDVISEYALPKWLVFDGDIERRTTRIEVPPHGKNRNLAALSQIRCPRIAVTAARVSLDLGVDFAGLLWHLRGRERRVHFLDGIRGRLKVPNAECLHAVCALLRAKHHLSSFNAYLGDLSFTRDGVAVPEWHDLVCCQT